VVKPVFLIFRDSNRMITREPGDAAEVAQSIRDAVASHRTLEIAGMGTRRDFGRPVQSDEILNLSKLSGIISYEPEELILTAQAAAPIAGIKMLLRQYQQHLAFEPPDLSALWGRPESAGSIGGALATGLGGSRRISAGSPRDHFLGFKAVNGLGQIYSAGGKVVKNVTGYDLPKLLAGSFGTLSVLTEVTIKVLPAPRETRTLAIYGIGDQDGLGRLRTVLGSSAPVTGAALLPAVAAMRMPDAMKIRSAAVVMIRLEGIEAAVTAGASAVIRRVAQDCEVESFDADYSRQLWEKIGGAHVFADSDSPVWRLSIPPATASAVGEALRRAGATSLYYDWGGGAVWVEGPLAGDGRVGLVRRIATEAGGHAILVRGTREMRERVEVFQPLEAGVAGLTARVKSRFDPLGLLNPGRMYRSV
jgi:glycolate oxidase FAD binding subunit